MKHSFCFFFFSLVAITQQVVNQMSHHIATQRKIKCSVCEFNGNQTRARAVTRATRLRVVGLYHKKDTSWRAKASSVQFLLSPPQWPCIKNVRIRFLIGFQWIWLTEVDLCYFPFEASMLCPFYFVIHIASISSLNQSSWRTHSIWWWFHFAIFLMSRILLFLQMIAACLRWNLSIIRCAIPSIEWMNKWMSGSDQSKQLATHNFVFEM